MHSSTVAVLAPHNGKDEAEASRDEMTAEATTRPKRGLAADATGKTRGAETGGASRGAEIKAELVRGAHLLAPLCSAARPVWMQVNRHALDAGPDGDCLDGLPTSDLSPRSIREINLPYRAEWCGIACCNHGIYRFQFDLDVSFTVFVDDIELCVHTDEKGETQFAHACLDGEHIVRVMLEGWTCQQKFVMDVYRIR